MTDTFYTIQELERMFDININNEPDSKNAEGCLSEYTDTKNSVEWVRDIRDNP